MKKTSSRYFKEKNWQKPKTNGFACSHCKKHVSTKKSMGTAHRNHCPFCLWSKHIDQEKSGDRKSECRAEMKPIGLTFKHEGCDKWGHPRQGELMTIHQCTGCETISINRIAGDDSSDTILEIFEESHSLNSEIQRRLLDEEIKLLKESDRQEIETQLFGKK